MYGIKELLCSDNFKLSAGIWNVEWQSLGCVAQWIPSPGAAETGK
jgi:hypothetical protein